VSAFLVVLSLNQQKTEFCFVSSLRHSVAIALVVGFAHVSGR
jgi:hypothetical protein